VKTTAEIKTTRQQPIED